MHTIPDTSAKQILDHVECHGRELITIWKRRRDGAHFSDHFLGEARKNCNTPWSNSNANYCRAADHFPFNNRIPGNSNSLKCCHPGCDKTFTPRAGLNGPRIRTYFYNTVRRHEGDCAFKSSCPIADREGVVHLEDECFRPSGDSGSDSDSK